MRFQQMFVTINMLVDHTASSPIMPQLDHASCIKTTELASPSGPSGNGVVLPLSTQLFNQQKEDVERFKAQVAKTYDPSSVTMKHRKMQQSAVSPPGVNAQQQAQSNEAMKDFYSDDDGNLFHKTWVAWGLAGIVSIIGLGAIGWLCKTYHSDGPSGSGKVDPHVLADMKTAGRIK